MNEEEKDVICKEDVKRHVLCSPHSLISEKEREEMLKRYKIAPEQLPKIRMKDAALEDLNVKAGDIIRVERRSITAGIVIAYRFVIP